MTEFANANADLLTADELDHVVGGTIVYQDVAHTAVQSQSLPLTPTDGLFHDEYKHR